MSGEPAADVERRMLEESCDRPIQSGPCSELEAHRSEPIEEGSLKTSGGDYWIRSRYRIIRVGLIDNHSFTRECIATTLQYFDNIIKIFPFSSCEDCLLGQNERWDAILYFEHLCARDQSILDELPRTLMKLMQLSPTIILSTVDNVNLALRAFRAGARGFVPTTETTIEMVVEIIRLVRAGGMFVPPSSLSLRQRIGENASPMPIATEMFTPKELAVLDKLRLGKPNKIIAHELMMSESTIKAHIRSIMEKMKVKNRTEIVSLWLSSSSMMLLISPFERLSPI